ncbi:MAG: hypothetical protein KI791_22350 [Cyclobacteriaceae bacterium]|nr:hypothetical protein [Cyclobacteriaceae bacterium SS2]
MKSNLALYLGILILIFAGVFALHYYEVATERKHPGTTDLSLETDLHLSNSRLYIKERSIERSLYHLNSAIHSIELIEEFSDSVSIEELETALSDLKKVRAEIEKGIVNYEHINHAFVIALNSVATAQLRLTERYLLKGDAEDASYAIKYANEHIHNALKYANDGEIQDELRAYRHIDSLVHSRLDSSRIFDIERVITEIKVIK